MFFDFIPKTVKISTSCTISIDVIGGVSDPERSNRGVGLEHVGDSYRADGEVVSDGIFSLDTVFNKEVVPADTVSHVFLY